jgi:hypothetical protein
VALTAAHPGQPDQEKALSINPAAVLGLVSELYERIAVVQERCELLERALTETLQNAAGPDEPAEAQP